MPCPPQVLPRSEAQAHGPDQASAQGQEGGSPHGEARGMNKFTKQGCQFSDFSLISDFFENNGIWHKIDQI